MLIPFDKLFPKYNLQFTGVMHVGANVGEEHEMYNKLGIKKQIWIEANPDIFTKLCQHVGDGNDRNILCLNVAAGSKWARMNFHVSSNGSQSSSLLNLGTHKIEHPDVHYVRDISVVVVPLAEYLMSYEWDQLDLLNLDVQGYELEVLKGMRGRIGQFKAVYTEVNKAYVYEDCALVEDMDYYLGVYGFSRVETYWAPNKNWGDALYVKM